jgi:hypothetical protein
MAELTPLGAIPATLLGAAPLEGRRLWHDACPTCPPGLPGSVPLGLPRIPGPFHPRRRGAEHLLGAAERAEVLSGSARRRRSSARRPGRTAAIVGSPAWWSRASSPASLAMRFSTAATRARPGVTLAVPVQSSPGSRCGSGSLCRARTRTPPLIWRLLCSSGCSLVLTDQAVDDLPAHDPGGHIDRLASLVLRRSLFP